MFTKGEVTKPRFHTPSTYRSQRQLHFSPATTAVNSGSPPRAKTDSPSTGNNDAEDAANALLDFSTPAPNSKDAASDSNSNQPVSTQDNPDKTDNSSTRSPPSNSEDVQNLSGSENETKKNADNAQFLLPSSRPVLPWEFAGNKFTSLYKASPPKLKYPGGSRDENINKRFLKRMDMFLNKNFLVRSVLRGDTPHPFSTYDRLKQYWHKLGYPDWVFNTSETFATLNAIKINGHLAFHAELSELLWFGGVVSYGNIMSEVYTIIYEWVDDEDFIDLEGLCEEQDGITFRKVIIGSLRIIRVHHKQEIINNLYDKLDAVKLCMRPGGMLGYFSQLRKFRLQLNQQGERVSDSYLIRRTKLAVKGKHPKLDDVIADLRRKAGTSGSPTTFNCLKDSLTDTFIFEVPDSKKTEKPTPIPVNFAGNGKPGAGNDSENPKKRRRKRKFPKGSCPRCPESTTHTGEYCYKTVRERMGLPPGWQWCLQHKEGIHYEHLCKRHAPNYPPVPKITACPAVATPSPVQLKDHLLAMIASTNNLQHNRDSPIKITKPTGQQHFQPAHVVPTNVATHGPPVDQILDAIVALSPEQREKLQTRLADADL